MERIKSWLFEVKTQRAIKELDKSSFDGGSHIPKLVRPIFECENVKYGEKKRIILEYLDEEYSAYIEQEKNGKIRMSWRKLIPILKEKFYEEYDILVNENQKLDNAPKLEFIKIEENKFNIDMYRKEINKIDEFFEEIGIDTSLGEEEIIGLIKKYIVTGRINQNKYREKLLKEGSKCKICGLKDERFLIASHSKSWVESNEKEKVDVNNGFLLCPNHDKLYDKYLITFSDSGEIVISETINKDDYSLLGIKNDIKINISGEQLVYVRWHRKKFFEREKEDILKVKKIDRYKIELV